MPHVPIDIDSINWDQYINVQEGGARYFQGQRYMRGYGILGNIGKFLLPIAKNLATSVGSEGIEAGSKVLKDVTEGKNLTEALKEHSKKGLENLGEKLKQCGKGQNGGAKKKRKKKKRSQPKQPTVSMYPPRPASPTSLPLKKPTVRRRKKDQLDIF